MSAPHPRTTHPGPLRQRPPKIGPIGLLAVGEMPAEIMKVLGEGAAAAIGGPFEILPERLDPAFAFHAERGQYHATEILVRVRALLHPGAWRLLAVAGVDLYIPILTFVFGEAQMGGPCAIISGHRLRQEFYGLPAAPDLFRERLLKEAVHELGHTCGLTHCESYRCVMSASHSVERIDLKEALPCPDCAARVMAAC